MPLKTTKNLMMIRKHVFNKREPVSPVYGLDRGQAIDRYYIEGFLRKEKSSMKGHCLEILNDDYTKKYGGKRITKLDVLDIDTDNPHATVFGDLRHLDKIKSNTYDCVVLTQTVHVIDDAEAVVSECHRILKKGGVLLVTLPAMSRVDVTAGEDDDHWRYTAAGARFLFKKCFKGKAEVTSHGNVLAGLGFWVGLSQEDLTPADLAYNDPSFPITITVKATKG